MHVLPPSFPIATATACDILTKAGDISVTPQGIFFILLWKKNICKYCLFELNIVFLSLIYVLMFKEIVLCFHGCCISLFLNKIFEYGFSLTKILKSISKCINQTMFNKSQNKAFFGGFSVLRNS